MENGKLDRRTQRTREQLQQALTELMAEKNYDSITVQDITERANLGRTTFYAHFNSKTDLYLHAHFEAVARMGQDSLTMDQLLAPEPPDYFVKFLEFIARDRATQINLSFSQDVLLIVRAMRQHVSDIVERCLRGSFSDESSHIPFTVLASYLGVAQVEHVASWLELQRSLTPQELAQYYHPPHRPTLLHPSH